MKKDLIILFVALTMVIMLTEWGVIETIKINTDTTVNNNNNCGTE